VAVSTKINKNGATKTYPYFDVAGGMSGQTDPESYADGSVATGRVFHARDRPKVKEPDKKQYHDPPG